MVQVQPVSYCVTNVDMACDREWHEWRLCGLLIDANVYGMRNCLYDTHRLVGLCHDDGCHIPINWGQPLALYTALSCLLSTVMCHLLSQTLSTLTKGYKLTWKIQRMAAHFIAGKDARKSILIRTSYNAGNVSLELLGASLTIGLARHILVSVNNMSLCSVQIPSS